ncbi:hypothetical protein TNIN_117531 [Trichonephila inaurata madagascariensis]|uniref:Uncharacterized protein n=1 Tax=Trichonephila inaurata madagascariensis TaxID=2747483 RepID=A0A8X6IIA3_9ARAC|nr:hypothetical protein TNIN_117531 [Trichonephila inaurata madagascariensis]
MTGLVTCGVIQRGHFHFLEDTFGVGDALPVAVGLYHYPGKSVHVGVLSRDPSHFGLQQICVGKYRCVWEFMLSYFIEVCPFSFVLLSFGGHGKSLGVRAVSLVVPSSGGSR